MNRAYTFTLNNYSEEEYKSILSIKAKYIVVGKEVGDSGTPHLQGYVYYANARSFVSVCKGLPRAHVEVAVAGATSNFEYCSKDGDFVEVGDRPMSSKEKGEGEVKRWELALTSCRENRLEDIPADICGRHLKSLEYAASKLGKRKLESLPHESLHDWYFGAPGTGKSRRAREENVGAYIKDPQSSWWDGYNNEDVVIIDDFDKYQVKQGGDLKRWMDIYPFQAQVKGGQLEIRPKRIIVTSNYTPGQIWDDKVTVEAILRRVRVTDFNSLSPIVDSFYILREGEGAVTPPGV